MKNRISLFVCLVFSVLLHAQSTPLHIQGTGGRFYLIHTVVAKENWYSIGRLFNTSPHDIASFNNLNMEKPLDISQQLNIPLSPVNFDQKMMKTSDETLIPVYHVVDDKEWMFKISSTYNDVPVTSLEKWNKIKRDDLRKGMPLIVGFLKVKTDLSPLAVGVASNPVTAAQASEPPIVSSGNKTTPVPAPVTAVVNTSNTQSATPVSNGSERVNNYAATHSNGGFFSIDYNGGGKPLNGQAGTFKSTSGWGDGKYYALMNNIPVGTIIRVSGMNGKTIYAKVLGQLPEMKESNGLLVRISNAGSAELGLGEGKFPVEIKY